MRRSALLLTVPVAALLLAGCGGGGGGDGAAAATSPGTVVVKNLRYSPKTLTVAVGDTVTWSFDDGRIPHDVRGDGFAAPTRSSGTWTHTFTRPGSYSYHCSLHPYMKGTVEVR